MVEMYEDIGASVLGKRLEDNVWKTDYLVKISLNPPETKVETIWDLIMHQGLSVLSRQVETETKKLAYNMTHPVRVCVFIFPYNIRVHDALDRVESVYGYKLGTIAQLVTLGFCYPKIQERLPIIVSGNDSVSYPYDLPNRKESENWIFGIGRSVCQGRFITSVSLRDVGPFAVLAEEVQGGARQ